MTKKYMMNLALLVVILLLGACGKAAITESTLSRQSTKQSLESETSESDVMNSSDALRSSSVAEVQQFTTGALLEAIEKGETDKMKEILENPNFNREEQDSDGNSPLNIAVQKNDIEAAKLLIKSGADINHQNKISDSPYLYAGAEGRTEILRFMLEHGEPDLTKTNRYGGNTLIPAAEKGHFETVKLLLADGREKIDFQNDFGYTALIEAIALNDGTLLYQDIIKALLEAGADQHIKDNSGRSAADYAKQLGFTEMIEILETY